MSHTLGLVQQWCESQQDLSVPHKAWGHCVIASQGLAQFLQDQGIDASLIRMTGVEYQGREHWAVWVEAEEIVIDTTARQFDTTAQFPLVKGLWEWGDDGCEWLVDGLVLTCFPFSGSGFLTVEPEWSEVHIREDIEAGQMVYPAEALGAKVSA